MINIRPVSDLRNKYPEIEELVLREDEAVYLTKNGYGSMVVMSLEKYSKMIEELEIDRQVAKQFENTDVKKVLDEIDEEIKNDNTTFLSHEEIFGKLRRKPNEK